MCRQFELTFGTSDSLLVSFQESQGNEQTEGPAHMSQEEPGVLEGVAQEDGVRRSLGGGKMVRADTGRGWEGRRW